MCVDPKELSAHYRVINDLAARQGVFGALKEEEQDELGVITVTSLCSRDTTVETVQERSDLSSELYFVKLGWPSEATGSEVPRKEGDEACGHGDLQGDSHG